MYFELFEEHTKDDMSKENIINALSVINATILAKMADDTNDNDEIILFSDFFIDKFLDDEMEKALFNNWGDYPLVLRMGIGLKEDKKKQTYKKHKTSIDLLTDYIIEKKNKTFVTAITSLPNQYCFPAKKNKEIKEGVKDIVTDLFIFKGSMVIREVKDDKFEICGFHIKNNRIISIPADEMKYCTELQPDGTIKTDDREIFIQAPIIFPNE